MGVGEHPPVRSVARALQVLELLGQRDAPATLAELARELSIPKSTLLGILRTLASAGWVEQQAEGFGLGIRSLLVGSAFVTSDPVVTLVEPVLDQLVAELGETAHLGRLDGGDVVYLAKHESPHPLRMFSAVGRRLPAHATALGKVLLAGLAEDDVSARTGRHLARLTPATITDPAALAAELATIRQRGWARDEQENTEGIVCLAIEVPVQAVSRDALSVSIPVSRLTGQLAERTIAALQAARAQLQHSPQAQYSPQARRSAHPGR